MTRLSIWTISRKASTWPYQTHGGRIHEPLESLAEAVNLPRNAHTADWRAEQPSARIRNDKRPWLRRSLDRIVAISLIRRSSLSPQLLSHNAQTRLQGWERPYRTIGALRVRLSSVLSHRITTHLDTMGVVNQTVEDAVSDRSIANLFMPACHGHLRGQYHTPGLVALFANLPESRRSGSVSGAIAQSSTTSTSIRLIRASKWRKLPSARARANSRNSAAARV